MEFGPWRITVRPAVAPETHPEDLDHVFLAREAIRGTLTLRPRQTGDALSLPKRGRKTVKKLFIDARVPRLEREQWPVLADGDSVLYVPGFGPDTAHLAAPGQESVEILSQKKD